MSLLTSALQQRAKKASSESQKLTGKSENIVEFTVDSPSEPVHDDQLNTPSSTHIEHPVDPELEAQETLEEPHVDDVSENDNLPAEQQVSDPQNDKTATSSPEPEVISAEVSSKSEHHQSPENIQLTTKSVFNLQQKAPIKRKKYYWVLALAIPIILILSWFLYDYYMGQNELTFHLPPQNSIDSISAIESLSGSELMVTTSTPLPKIKNTPLKQTVAPKSPANHQNNQETTTNKAIVAQINTTVRTPKPKSLVREASLPPSGLFENSTKPSNQPIQIKRNPVTQTESQHIAKAYTNLAEGHLDQALWHYQQVLKRSPNNPHTLAGLASIQMRKGSQDEARLLYQQLLKIDPNSVVAKSGLLAIDSKQTPQTIETGLRSLLHNKPNDAYLNGSLGNQYAARGAWYKAQQTYYKAIKAAPKNPDYHFNLAISLEYVQRYQEALKYYAKALSLSASKPIHFDRQQAQERIDRLKEVYP